jgi:hypothetical protein
MRSHRSLQSLFTKASRCDGSRKTAAATRKRNSESVSLRLRFHLSSNKRGKNPDNDSNCDAQSSTCLGSSRSKTMFQKLG